MQTMTENLFTLPISSPVAIFLLVLVIILLAPTLFSRLKVPTIVVLIIMGMAVGPYGLNLLARDASFAIFGQVGILYLMFLAAVEIDMLNLRKNYKRGGLFGLITFFIPAVAGLFITKYAFGIGWNTSLLLAAIFGSHTLISYPIVTRFGLSGSQSVVVAVCATIVAVLITLVVLAEVVTVSIAGSFAWISLAFLIVLTLIYVVAVGWSFPRITRWFFQRYLDPVTQFIYILAMVLLASLLAELIGLEAILGAFYAGLVLNRFVPERSALMHRIQFVGNAIFIPYFLIGVGMLINVQKVFSSWRVIYVAAVMTLVALLTKWIAAWIGQKCLHFTPTGRKILFGLTSGKAAATIAAIMIGYQYGLITEEIMNGAVVMILGCCAVASIVTESATRRLRMRKTEEVLERTVDDDHRENARQLVAVANPVTATEIMNLAILMRHKDNRNPITTLFVQNNDDEKTAAIGKRALRMAEEAAQAVDVDTHPIERYDTNIVSGMVNVMKERQLTDLIIGMHRRTNIVDTFFGSKIEQLISASNSMVTLSRCFMPIDTMKRLVVVVPGNAEYETGFRLWVERVGNLAVQLSCKIIFIAFSETSRYIKGVLKAEGYDVRQEYRDMAAWDDFITYSSQIEQEDLLIIIGARRTSVSFTSDLESLPVYLSRYFAGQNLLLIYPEQFGDDQSMPTPIEALAQPFSTNPTPSTLSLLRLKELFNKHIRPD